jgi:hypothetical protein
MEITINHGTLDDIEFPTILYKYRDWSNDWNKKFIIEREVYMASPNQFEDKLDCKIPISYEMMNENQAEKFYDRLSRLAQPNLSRQQRRREIRNRIKAKEYKNEVKNQQYQKFYFDQYFQRIGILSLTAEPCLDEMWKKYANDQKGFCVGYNSRILFEHLGGGAKVEYFDEMPILLPDPIMNREEIRFKQVYFKERKWEFEQEYRTQKFWFDGATANDRNIKIPKEAFNSVILGKNMTQKDKLEITKAIKENIGIIKIIEHKNVC